MKVFHERRKEKEEDKKMKLNELKEDFEGKFKDHILQRLKARAYCNTCNKKYVTCCNLITEESLPPFFFVEDPTKKDPRFRNEKGDLKERGCQPYFPPVIHINAPLAVEYALHARMYSWFPPGSHFFIVEKKKT